MNRRDFVRSSLGAIAGVGLISSLPGAQQASLPAMTVYKSADCGCCTLWIDHVRAEGFTVRFINTDNLGAVKRELGVPPRLGSCHTAVVGGYTVEGHVPASDIKRLLQQKPKVKGLAVPGMPIGSPGMEQGPPANYERYNVLTFTAEGTTAVFATHGPPRGRL